MKRGRLQEIFTENLAKLILFAVDHGYHPRLAEVERTTFQQYEYVQAGKSKTMESQHLKRLAADINFFKDGCWVLDKEELQFLGDYWESLFDANHWGGNWEFQDCPHFETSGG